MNLYNPNNPELSNLETKWKFFQFLFADNNYAL